MTSTGTLLLRAFLVAIVIPVSTIGGSVTDYEGRYVGYLSCGSEEPRKLELELKVTGRRKDRLEGMLTVSWPSSNVRGTMRVKGGVDSYGMSLETKKWTTAPPKGFEFAPAVNGALHGNVIEGGVDWRAGPRWLCDLNLSRVGTPAAEAALMRIDRELRIREGQAYLATTPPERRNRTTRLSSTEQWMDYYDARMSPEGWKDAEIEPVDKASADLKEKNLKCLVTYDLEWTASRMTMEIDHFGSKTYVLDCDGNCKGLRYRVSGFPDTIVHFGSTEPVPVLFFRAATMGKWDLHWQFTLADPSAPAPKVRIHTWTADWGDYGPGCRLFQ
jgi:hypothetical protein